MRTVHSKSFRMRPNSLGVPYAFRRIMARRIAPFKEDLNIVRRDSHLDGDNSEFAEELPPNRLPSAGDGTTLPLKDMASISKTFGRLATPFERDLCGYLTKIWPKKTKSASMEMCAPESAKDIYQSWIQLQRSRRVCRRKQNRRI